MGDRVLNYTAHIEDIMKHIFLLGLDWRKMQRGQRYPWSSWTTTPPTRTWAMLGSNLSSLTSTFLVYSIFTMTVLSLCTSPSLLEQCLTPTNFPSCCIHNPRLGVKPRFPSPPIPYKVSVAEIHLHFVGDELAQLDEPDVGEDRDDINLSRWSPWRLMSC